MTKQDPSTNKPPATSPADAVDRSTHFEANHKTKKPQPSAGEQLVQKRQDNVLGRLYHQANVPEGTLNKVILSGVLLMFVLLIYFASSSKGFLVTFDARGGSDVPSQRILYGETVTRPEAPTREGYRFVSWSLFAESDEPYDFSLPVERSFELFARWEEQTTP